jgi:hypothetical protein
VQMYEIFWIWSSQVNGLRRLLQFHSLMLMDFFLVIQWGSCLPATITNLSLRIKEQDNCSDCDSYRHVTEYGRRLSLWYLLHQWWQTHWYDVITLCPLKFEVFTYLTVLLTLFCVITVNFYKPSEVKLLLTYPV